MFAARANAMMAVILLSSQEIRTDAAKLFRSARVDPIETNAVKQRRLR